MSFIISLTKRLSCLHFSVKKMLTSSSLNRTSNPWSSHAHPNNETAVNDINEDVLNNYSTSTFCKTLQLFGKINETSKDISEVTAKSCNLLSYSSKSVIMFHNNFDEHCSIVEESLQTLETVSNKSEEVEHALKTPHVGSHMRLKADHHNNLKTFFELISSGVSQLQKDSELLERSYHPYAKEELSYLHQLSDPSLSSLENKISHLEDQLT